MNEKQSIEALLFVSGKSLSHEKLGKILNLPKERIKEFIQEMQSSYSERGIRLLDHNDKVELVTGPEVSEVVRHYLQDERSGELTRAALETLAIVAYRAPVSKTDIELIRGINCSLILRNLMIRGLIEERMVRGMPYYSLSLDMMKFLGIQNIQSLPEYEKLRGDMRLGEILLQQQKQKDFFEEGSDVE